MVFRAVHHDRSDAGVAARFRAGGSGSCKKKLLDVMEERFLGDIIERRGSFVARGYQYIDEIIAAGNERAQARIKPVVEGAIDRVGLITRWR